jgi:hypothetical protein
MQLQASGIVIQTWSRTCPFDAVQVVQGVHQKCKMVQFAEMSREAVYNRMQDAVRRGFTVGANEFTAPN